MRTGRSRKGQRAGVASIGIVVMVFMVIMGAQIVRLNNKLDEKEARLSELQEQYEEELLRTSELEELEAYMQSDEYIEEMARSKLGLVYDDEIIYKESEE
ncbi:MAG: septum formation initiator family protein [Clostridiales bacterium]|nr:septum formation initiator family protein [Clostridiales bacterium]